MVIGCYLYWRSEKWGHKLHVPGDPAKDEVWR
jgi:hypothetical protein